MSRPAPAQSCCDLHDLETRCGERGVCCDWCVTYGDESDAQLLFAAIFGVVLLVLFAVGLG